MRLINSRQLLIATALIAVGLCSSLSIAAQTSSEQTHIVVFGDSLSAAYGFDIEQGWAHLLAQHYLQQGDPITITNASISGETSAGGLTRLPLTLQSLKPDWVILELGANDGLRGYPIAQIQANLQNMINLIQASGAQVILIGVSLPANYSPRYVDQFTQVFTELAELNKLAFFNFYQSEFIGNPDYVQADGLHPTRITQAIIQAQMVELLDSLELIKQP